MSLPLLAKRHAACLGRVAERSFPCLHPLSATRSRAYHIKFQPLEMATAGWIGKSSYSAVEESKLPPVTVALLQSSTKIYFQPFPSSPESHDSAAAASVN